MPRPLTTLCLAALTALPATLPAQAADPVHIAVGQPGRGYEKRGQDMATRLSQRGHEVTVDNYEGSDAISLAVCGGRAQAGIIQIDAIYAREQENCTLKIVGTYGDEYAFMLFPPDERHHNELSDLKAGDKVLVDTIGSGTELFWRTIVGIETGEFGNNSSWAQATPVHDLIMLADTLAATGDIDAVMMVGLPQNKEALDLLDKGWTLGELYDKDINDMEYRGGSLYETRRVEIDIEGRWRHLRNDAYVVPSFIVVPDTLQTSDPALYRDIAAAAQ